MFQLTKPCPNCPFRQDIPGYLRGVRAREIIDALLADDYETFPCHKTTTTVECDDGFSETISTATSQQCAGATVLLHRLGSVNVAARLAVALGQLDLDALDAAAPTVAQSREAFILHHALAWRSRELPLVAAVLRGLLDEYADAPTECDGQSRIIAHVLTEAGIPFRAWVGILRRGERSVTPHLWVTVGAGQPGDPGCVVVDYRRRMWLGDDVAEGVLLAGNLGETSYHDAQELALGQLDPATFAALTVRFDVAALLAQQEPEGQR